MKLYTLLLGLLISSTLAFGQGKTSYTEFGIGAGTLNYSGDIATTVNTSALLEEMRPAFEVFGTRHFNDRFAAGLFVRYGWFYANDANHSHQKRGLSVETSVFQVNPFLEMNLIRFGKWHYDQKFTIFVRAGGGLVAYNPDVEAQEVFPQTFDPRPNAYSSFNFTFSGGVKFRVTYTDILSLRVHYTNSGADDMDGILHQDPEDGGANDVFGGVALTYSRALF